MIFGPGEFTCKCKNQNGDPIPCNFTGSPAGQLCPTTSAVNTQETFSSSLPVANDNSQIIGSEDSQILESVSNVQQTESADDSFNGQVESCSLEFYRTHASSADGPNSLWPQGYNPNDKFSGVAYFNSGIIISSGENPTLLQALHAEGDGINKLARQAVTALLNAANPNVDYHFSVTQIIDLTQRAIMNNDYSIADEFESYNVIDGNVICKDYPVEESNDLPSSLGSDSNHDSKMTESTNDESHDDKGNSNDKASSNDKVGSNNKSNKGIGK